MESSKKIPQQGQTINYNTKHRVGELPPLKLGQRVWIRDLRKYGEVIEIGPQPRSYILKYDNGLLRRNRFFFIPAPDKSPTYPWDDYENKQQREDEKEGVGGKSMVDDESNATDRAKENEEHGPVKRPFYIIRFGRVVKPRYPNDSN